MRRMQMLGSWMIAALALCGLLAASAYAVTAPEFIPKAGKSFPTLFTLLTGTGVTLFSTSKYRLKCEVVSNDGLILAQPTTTSSMLGDIRFDYRKCLTNVEMTLLECKSGGLPNGLILTPNYLWHIGALNSKALDPKVVILITMSETTFECSGGMVSAEVKMSGNLIGLIHGSNKAGENQFGGFRKTLEVEFEQFSPGFQSEFSIELTLPAKTVNESLQVTIKTALGTETEKASDVTTLHETYAGGEEIELATP